MSGTISFSPTVRWSAASWLFDWVLQSLADAVKDAELAAELRGVVHENIGWLGINDLKREHSVEIRDVLMASLAPAAERSFPVAMPRRQDALQHLDELIRLASDTS